jgi:hypothetical protein
MGGENERLVDARRLKRRQADIGVEPQLEKRKLSDPLQGDEPSAPLQPHYVISRLNLIDDQDQTGRQSRERTEVCDGLGRHCKTAFHFDPGAVRDAA